jgi:peptide-methionine (R)-S-oxide reductase
MNTRRTFFTSIVALSAAAGLTWSRGFAAGPTGVFEVTKTDEEWRKLLSPEAFNVLRKHGTERAGSSPLDKIYTPGVYNCAGCDLALFTSDTKFDSGTGWPSFHTPIAKALGMTTDRSWGMLRTEVHCSRCGGHQGHLFPDGPKPSGQRYCINGVSLKFVAKDAKAPS